jgi:hypothetical protein
MDLHSFDPADGPALPDLPPISIGALAVGLTDLFGKADGLVMPRTVVINETAQELMMMFAPVADSARIITAWAMRFGGVVDAHVCEALSSPHRHITATFDYYGVTVDAYTFIPIT